MSTREHVLREIQDRKDGTKCPRCFSNQNKKRIYIDNIKGYKVEMKKCNDCGWEW